MPIGKRAKARGDAPLTVKKSGPRETGAGILGAAIEPKPRGASLSARGSCVALDRDERCRVDGGRLTLKKMSDYVSVAATFPAGARACIFRGVTDKWQSVGSLRHLPAR